MRSLADLILPSTMTARASLAVLSGSPSTINSASDFTTEMNDSKSLNAKHPKISSIKKASSMPSISPISERPERSARSPVITKRRLSPRSLRVPVGVGRVVMTHLDNENKISKVDIFSRPRRLASPIIQLDGDVADLRHERDLLLSKADPFMRSTLRSPSTRAQRAAHERWSHLPVHRKLHHHIWHSIYTLAVQSRYHLILAYRLFSAVYLEDDYTIEEPYAPIVPQAGCKRRADEEPAGRAQPPVREVWTHDGVQLVPKEQTAEVPCRRDSAIIEEDLARLRPLIEMSPDAHTYFVLQYEYYVYCTELYNVEPDTFRAWITHLDPEGPVALGVRRYISMFNEDIVAQSGMPKSPDYVSMIKHQKIIERVQGASLSKGLGKSRKKGHKSKTVIKRSKSSCRVSDHKLNDKLSLDLFETIVPQMNFIPGLPTMKVRPDDDTSERLDEIIGLFEGFRNNGVDLNLNLGFMDSLKSISTKCFQGVSVAKIGAVATVIGLLVAGWNMYRSEDSKAGFWSCIFTVCSAVCSVVYSDVCGPIRDTIAKWLSSSKPNADGTEPIVAQSGAEDIQHAFLAFLYGLVAHSSSKKPDLASKVLSGFKTLGDMPKMSKGIEFTVEWLTNLTQRFLNHVAKMFDANPWIITSTPHPDEMEYLTRVSDEVDSFNRGVEIDYDYGLKIFALEKEGIGLAAKINTRLPSGQIVYRNMMLALQTLRPVLDRLRRANITGNGPRIPPIGILIGGASGIGKTSMSQYLMLKAGLHMVDPHERESFIRNHNNHIYNVNPENHFWDNYNGQTVVFQDDVGQSVDVAGNPDNEYFKTIRMINQNNFPLTMAHLEDKGNVNFRSKAVFATTNAEFFALQSIRSVEAFVRRYTVAYVATPKLVLDGSCVAKDPSKPISNPFNRRVKRFPHDPSDFSYLEFIPWDFEKGEATGPPIEFEALLYEVVSLYEKGRVFGMRTLASHGESLRAYAREQFGTIVPQMGEQGPRSEPTLGSDGDAQEPLPPGIPEGCKPVPGRPGMFFDPRVRSAFEPQLYSAGVSKETPSFSPSVKTSLPRFYKGFDGPHSEGFVEMLCRDMGVQLGDSRVLLELARHSARAKFSEFEGDFDEACVDFALEFKQFVEGGKRNEDPEIIPNKLSKALSASKETLSSAYVLIKEYKAQIAAFVMAMTLAKVLSSYFMPPVEGQSASGVRVSSTNTMARSHRNRTKAFRRHAFDKPRPPSKQIVHTSVTAQAGVADKGCQDILNMIVDKNTYRIKLKSAEEFMGICTFVQANHAVVPLHFGVELESRAQAGCDEVVELWASGSKEPTFQIPLCEVTSTGAELSDRADFSLFTFPMDKVKRHRSILKNWRKTSEGLQDAKFAVYVPLYRDKSWFVYSSWAKAKGAINYSFRDDPEPFFVDESYEYDIPTRYGDCGSLVFVRDTRDSQSKILGFHVAGQGNRGISNCVERGWIEDAIKAAELPEEVNIEDVGLENLPPLVQSAAAEDIRAQGFTPLATLEERVHMPTVSNIVPSPLRGTFAPSLYSPTYLRPTTIDGVIVDPMIKARAKYAKTPTPINPFIMKGVEDMLLHKLVNDSIFNQSWDKPRVFTFVEACEGIAGTPYFDGIPRNTSAGYPLSLHIPKGAKGKQHIFGSSGPYDFSTTYAVQLARDVDEGISMARRGQRGLHVYTDFLKDERRETSKALAGKARMVSGAPLLHTVMMRMYFGDFVRHIMENRIKNGIAIGINSTAEWDDLAKYLSSRSKHKAANLIAGDYSGFDGSLSKQFLLVILNLANRWYGDGEENAKIRTVLFEEIVNSRHLTGNLLYEWFGSNPSGCFLTAVLNSLVNLAAIYISSIVCLVGELEFRERDWGAFDWSTFSRKLMYDVTAITFGDDNIIAVTDDVRDSIDQNKLTRAMALIGFNYTPESKIEGDLAEPLRRIDDINFLKRKFEINTSDGRYTCPLALDVILEMPQWTKKSDCGEIVRSNIDAALGELSLHAESVFNLYAPLILSKSQHVLEYVPISTSYRSLQTKRIAAVGYATGL